MAATPRKPRVPRDASTAPFMGSEYMDAGSYLRRPARPIAPNEEAHGVNDSEFGVDETPER